MQSKYRYLLPLSQTALAATLLAHNFFCLPRSTYHSQQWDYQIVSGLNAPATLAVSQLLHDPDVWLSDPYTPGVLIRLATWLCAIWLLWYLAASIIGGNWQSVSAKRTRWRRFVDVAAIGYGVYVVIYGEYVVHRMSGATAEFLWLQWIVWSQVIEWFYARDLWMSFRHPAANASGMREGNAD